MMHLDDMQLAGGIASAWDLILQILQPACFGSSMFFHFWSRKLYLRTAAMISPTHHSNEKMPTPLTHPNSVPVSLVSDCRPLLSATLNLNKFFTVQPQLLSLFKGFWGLSFN